MALERKVVKAYSLSFPLAKLDDLHTLAADAKRVKAIQAEQPFSKQFVKLLDTIIGESNKAGGR